MAKFVLEIGFEEMPAGFLEPLCAELKGFLEKGLTDAHVEFEGLATYATPRRLTAIADSVAKEQSSSEETVTGPPVRVAFDADGNPTKAAEGFAKTQGVDLADAFKLETDKGEYLAVKKTTGGGKTMDLLPAMCTDAVNRLNFGKKMRWGAKEFAFGRPMHWLLALLDDKIVEFEAGGVESGRTTRGHRVMGAGPFDVASAADYETVVANDAKVVLDAAGRRETIIAQGDAAAKSVGGAPVWKQSLLDEVCGLVEAPRVILGDFDESFLQLPREVLLTSMESHQKSFGVENSDGSLKNHFLCTLNIEPKDLSLVKKGWERVLRARLEDGRFFWQTDLKRTMDQWTEELDNVIFLAPLGSMGAKTRRIETLCGWLAEQVDPALTADVKRAGRISKADLVSEMVGEFASLQGVMGAIYAAKGGENETVATAIGEQYLPAGPDSPVPATMAGALLSIADKADTLAGCFGLKMIPTGANDPYALRRAVLGITRIVLEKNLRIDLRALLEKAQAGYENVNWKLQPADALAKLMEFSEQRLKSYFASQGYETLIVEAAAGADASDVWALSARLTALAEFAKGDDFEQAVLTFKRAANIIRKQGDEAGAPLTGEYKAELLAEEQEKALAAALEAAQPRFEELWTEDRYAELMGLLRELRPAVDAFFDNVMVMCKEEDLRLNRLNLLQALVSQLGRLADFSALQI